MNSISSNIIKQFFLLLSITALTILMVWQLWYFVPGLLGAITLYICLRKWFFVLTIVKKWKKWFAITTVMIATFITLVLPVLGVIQLLIPKITYAINNTDMFVEMFNKGKFLLAEYFPDFKVSDEQLQGGIATVTGLLTKAMSGTAHIFVNILVAFFLLYFMLMNGRQLEKGLRKYMPLHRSNAISLWNETRIMVISNAVGIPVLTACQCVVAILGYWIFNVDQFVFWGLLTGVASIIPVVGCMAIYLPLTGYLFAIGSTGPAIGVLLYSAILTSNIDNVLRFTILKRIGDVHPIITVFGVIMGLQIFGIMGLIFGPLLLAYFILLFKVYYREFDDSKITTAKRKVTKLSNSQHVIGKEE
jgi:predicted PurR-regulated permease PerM